MARIPGIKIETTLRGEPKTALIDLKKHKKITDLLIEIGALPQPKETNLKDFTKGCMSGEEFKRKMHSAINKWPERKK